VLCFAHADDSVACIIGASIIWIDLLICHIPGKSGFNIQESSVFLASALSLSFGVMVRFGPVIDLPRY
jgi:hypothetical protein